MSSSPGQGRKYGVLTVPIVASVLVRYRTDWTIELPRQACSVLVRREGHRDGPWHDGPRASGELGGEGTGRTLGLGWPGVPSGRLSSVRAVPTPSTRTY